MHDNDLLLIAADPDLTKPETAYALLALAESVSARDDDIAGDVIIELTELLQPGGRLRARLGEHPNPPALLTVAAKYAAGHAHERNSRTKRQMPLAPDGDLTSIDVAVEYESPIGGLLELLEDRGWTTQHLDTLAIPRQRAGRSIHPGIEQALERLAACYGVIDRCVGCPSPMDLLRIDLRGPDSWPHLVPVLHEWGWSDELIHHITTSPANIAHWRTTTHRPPARQERRMIEIARRMRYQPSTLQHSDQIRRMTTPLARHYGSSDLHCEPSEVNPVTSRCQQTTRRLTGRKNLE